MRPFWQTGFGKLVIGGCGLQLGLVLSLAGVTFVLMFCALCVTTNVITLGLAGQLAQTDLPNVPAQAAEPSADVNSLLSEVDFLLTQIEAVQLQEPAAVPPVLPAGGKPVVRAMQSEVSLYSGPGIDYAPVSRLAPGESAEIVGRNVNSTWWLVALSNGSFAWAFNALVTAINVNETIPVVTTPSELVQPASFGVAAVATPPPPAPPAPPTPTSTPTLPPGTPTPAAEVSRQYVEDTAAYQKIKGALLTPPGSLSFSPDGSRFAMTERIRIYTVGLAGAHTDIWLEDNDKLGPMDGLVWSPDGQYLAFVVGFKQKYCRPCRAVGMLNLAEKTITYLTPPDPSLDTDMPRWTQDGRLLINAHGGEPADGVAYVYNIYGESQKAEGIYVLSASHEGQKWFPWRPGRIWQAGVSERADSYNSD